MASREKKYRTIIRRAVALLLDSTLLLVVVVSLKKILAEFHMESLESENMEKISSALLYLYSVFCHARFGRTVGKFITKVRVFDESEKGTIGYLRAIKRDIVPIFLIVTFWLSKSLLSSRVASNQEFREMLFNIIAAGVSIGWLLLEIGSMLINKKGRAVHDLIAGTVVVRFPYVERAA